MLFSLAPRIYNAHGVNNALASPSGVVALGDPGLGLLRKALVQGGAELLSPKVSGLNRTARGMNREEQASLKGGTLMYATPAGQTVNGKPMEEKQAPADLVAGGEVGSSTRAGGFMWQATRCFVVRARQSRREVREEE